MYDKFASEPADSHGLHIGVRDFPLDATKQAHKGGRLQVVQIAISEKQNSLLAFVHMVDFIKLDRQYNLFYVE